MADIELPNGGKAPLWATEETMKSLLNAVKGSSAFGNSGDVSEEIEKETKLRKDTNDKIKDFAKNIFKLNDKNEGIVRLTNNTTLLAKNFGEKGLAGGLELASSGILDMAETAGKYSVAVGLAAYALEGYAKLLTSYMKVLPQAIDAGLGFSKSLGDSAVIADKAGLSLENFYSALEKTDSTYRALGDNAMEAASNFGLLQSSVRDTFGTFGQSNKEFAEGSAAYVKLMAQTGLRGNAAVDAAASTYGNSMEQLRKISIATGTSLSKLQGSMKELMANPVVIAGMNKLGKSTEDAVIKMAKASAGFESVFGDLGRDLYKQMAEAEAAGLSIINTQLGAELAPFTDLGALTKFNKMLTEGGGTATEMAEAQRQFLASTEANLPTLLLLKQQGDKAAGQMLELYNKAKSAVIMSQDELDAQELKKRGEERLLNIQNKISAAYEKVVTKLFGFLDAIPVELFEGLGVALEGVGTVVGFFVEGLVGISKILGPIVAVLGSAFVAFKAVTAAVMLLTNPIGWAIAAITTLGVIITNWGSISEWASETWEASTKYISEKFTAIVSVVSDTFNYVTSAIKNGIAILWETMTAPFVALSNWFKSSWLGKKIFGDSGSASETASAPIMDSTPSNTAKSVQDATAAVAVAKAETTRATADKSSEHLERLARIAQESAEQQAVIAKNTGNTVDAVANSTASY